MDHLIIVTRVGSVVTVCYGIDPSIVAGIADRDTL